MTRSLLTIIMLLLLTSPSVGLHGIGMSMGFLQPSLSSYNMLLDSLGAERFGQSRLLQSTIYYDISEKIRLVLGAGQWIYDLPFSQPLSQRMPYERWTVQLVPITVSVEKRFTLPASIVKPFIGIGAGCCLIREKIYIPQKEIAAENTSTFLFQLYIGSEIELTENLALQAGYRRQFGKYQVIFGENVVEEVDVGIGGSTVWFGFNFSLVQK